MVRPRTLSLALLAVPLVAGAACSTPPEQLLLQKYFRASQARDNMTLQNIATVAFSPSTEGVVQKFTIESMGAEQRRTLRLRELAKALDEVQQEEKAFAKRKKEYQDANLEAIQRVVKAEAANQRLRGKDLEVQAAWRKWRDEEAEWDRKVRAARQALAADRGITELSVFDARDPVDATKFDGELITKTLVLDADVRSPEGTVTKKKLHVTLKRAELVNGPDGRAVSGRWIITHIGEQPEAQTSN